MVKKSDKPTFQAPVGEDGKPAEVKTQGWGVGDGATVAPVEGQNQGFTTDTPSGQPPAQTELPGTAGDAPAAAPTETKAEKSARLKAEKAAKAAADKAAEESTNDVMAADLIKGVERIERLNEELAGIKDDIGEFFGELKAKGYSVSVVRKVIARRAMDPDKRAEVDQLMQLYEDALARGTSLGKDEE